jgi:hypothetical protein
MWINYGVDWFGKVYSLPSHFSVKTRFFHIGDLPIIPLGSYFVVEKEDGVSNLADATGPRAFPIGWVAKSVTIAWLRASLWSLALLLIIPLIFFIIYYLDPVQAPRNPLFLYLAIGNFLLMIAFWWIADLVGKAKPASRKQLEHLAARLAIAHPNITAYIRERLDSLPSEVA